MVSYNIAVLYKNYQPMHVQECYYGSYVCFKVTELEVHRYIHSSFSTMYLCLYI